MRLTENATDAGPRFTVLLDVPTASEVARRVTAAVPGGVASDGPKEVQGSPYGIARVGDDVRVDVADGTALAAFLGGFVPGGIRLAADFLSNEGWGDYCEVHETEGDVTVQLRWVGDAASAEDGDEPQEVTFDAYRRFAERARELGFEAELLGHDHDTAELALRLPRPETVWAPARYDQVEARLQSRAPEVTL